MIRRLKKGDWIPKLQHARVLCPNSFIIEDVFCAEASSSLMPYLLGTNIVVSNGFRQMVAYDLQRLTF